MALQAASRSVASRLWAAVSLAGGRAPPAWWCPAALQAAGLHAPAALPPPSGADSTQEPCGSAGSSQPSCAPADRLSSRGVPGRPAAVLTPGWPALHAPCNTPSASFSTAAAVLPADGIDPINQPAGGHAPAQQLDPPPQYERVGKVTGAYTVARRPVFAVVEVGACQFKVAPDDLIYTEKLRGVDVNDRLALRRVLLVADRHTTRVGRPLLPGACVTAAVEEQFQDAKVLIFKKKRRKNHRRTRGHRQELTCLRILDVSAGEPASSS